MCRRMCSNSYTLLRTQMHPNTHTHRSKQRRGRRINRLAVTVGWGWGVGGGVGVKVMCTQGLTLAWVWDVLVLTRLEERGRLSALGCLIKGLQGREQATRVKITHTLHRAAGFGEQDRERRDSQRRRRRGWSRELRERGMGSDRGRGGQRAGSCNSIYFFSLLHLLCVSLAERDSTLL